MKDHNKYKEMLVEFLYGEISLDRESELLRHLSVCEECRKDLRILMEAREILKDLKGMEKPPEVIIEERVSFPWVALAFVLFLLLLSVGFFSIWGHSPSPQNAYIEASQQYIEVEPPPEIKVVLEDYEDYFTNINENQEKGGKE